MEVIISHSAISFHFLPFSSCCKDVYNEIDLLEDEVDYWFKPQYLNQQGLAH